MNDRAKEVLEYIKQRIDEGIPPSVREICEAMHMKSTSTAHRYINMLVEEGYLEKMDNQNRAIRLKGSNALRVPVIGTVTAGVPITAIENITEYVSYATSKHYSTPLFALNVRGESMINAGILDGDLVIVEQTRYAEDGEIVVALIDQEDATVKRFYREDGRFRLQPENDTMEPIYADHVEILGKVVALLRYF